MKKQTAIYYGLRVLQRFALLGVIGSTIVHWIVLIVIAANLSFNSQVAGLEYEDQTVLQDDINRMINVLSFNVLRTGIYALAVTGLFLLLKRVRSQEKAAVVDSAVIIIFCVISVVLSQLMVRRFMYFLAG